MENRQRIAIIGNGNVAHHLMGWFRNASHLITSVYTHSSKPPVGITSRSSLDYHNEKVDIILIAVKDDAVNEVAASLRHTGEAMILHTSGTVPLSALEQFDNYGVLYPLQTLQKGRKIALEKVPFLTEANNSANLLRLEEFCQTCCIHSRPVNSENRLLYHLSAVIGANFTNFLLHISEKNLKKSGLDMEVLRPLIDETVAKAFDQGAFTSQTGPARRNDRETIERHISLIDDPKDKEIYRLISESIIKEYHR